MNARKKGMKILIAEILYSGKNDRRSVRQLAVEDYGPHEEMSMD